MKRDFYESKDGTRVPIFIAHSKDLVLDGLAPTLLYGYGGLTYLKSPILIRLSLFYLRKVVYTQLHAQEEVVSTVKSGMRLDATK